MSASERLRALQARLAAAEQDPNDWDSGPFGITERWIGDTLIGSLPLIADVVEAAEHFEEIQLPVVTRLGRALTALREHLEGQ